MVMWMFQNPESIAENAALEQDAEFFFGLGGVVVVIDFSACRHGLPTFMLDNRIHRHRTLFVLVITD
jgi:hypothetical protein